MANEAHEPGFWLRVVEDDARRMVAGELPERVRLDISLVVTDYDNHLAAARQQLERVQHEKDGW